MSRTHGPNVGFQTNKLRAVLEGGGGRLGAQTEKRVQGEVFHFSVSFLPLDVVEIFVQLMSRFQIMQTFSLKWKIFMNSSSS